MTDQNGAERPLSSGPAPKPWYLYLVRTARGHLYTGITLDVARRFAEHQAGKGAKALRGKGPLALVYAECVGSHSEALRREMEVKRFSKARKEALVAAGQAALEVCSSAC
ncbi:GIY-YIG nuclease family protein [Gallaecimonas kandeliae]|uniref:GIY-YIG nuclease family protein n=1 Tax=Gallaecimonas kandeliae TaxID=3029055 RepID=UPI00264952E9|nr:GIY-YIG nuclease family protein [Gallaecimonas kandeliae]WKE67259.1 GIY-YIG nuclease family protein [Gallaecimonas kandeliae]